MKKFLMTLSTLALTTSAAASAPAITGHFNCDDGGTLEVSQARQQGVFFASLAYSDGSASTLASFEFRGAALRGQMLRDDEEADMGEVVVAEQGRTLVLMFTGDENVTCRK
jgi:hypothetical protein